MPFGLVLYDNQFTHHGVKCLARLVSADEINLYFLDISHNLVNDLNFRYASRNTPVCNWFMGLKVLTEAISSRGPRFIRVKLSSCGFTPRHAYHLILFCNQNIQLLNLANNFLGECVPFLLSALRTTKLLELGGTMVKSEDLVTVGEVLQSNTCLCRLNISYGMPDLKEKYQKFFIQPLAFCKLFQLITAPESKSELLVFLVPDCYMKDVDACWEVQIGFKSFASRRGYPLNLVRESLLSRRLFMSMDSANQLMKSSLS